MKPTSPVYWRFDIVTRTLIPSDGCRALHGLPSDAPFSYAEYLASIHPDDREEHRKALDRARDTGRFEARYRIIWPDGSVHRVRALGTVSPADDGAPFQIVGASIEETD
jgi:PAS domain-containing protein